MAVRSSLEGATGVQRTRAGHILIEFDKAVSIDEAAAKLRIALSDSMELAALVNRATVQMKNIDPLTSRGYSWWRKLERSGGSKRSWRCSR
jgi:hypothetical protein